MPTIRRQITIAASPRSVWNALTTVEGLAAWLGDEVRVDGRAGGRVSLRVRAAGGVTNEETGFFHVFRPTAKLEVSWDGRSPGPWKSTFTQFSVARDRNETVLNVVHEGPQMDDAEARATIDDTWRAALTSLRDGLERAAAAAAKRPSLA